MPARLKWDFLCEFSCWMHEFGEKNHCGLWVSYATQYGLDCEGKVIESCLHGCLTQIFSATNALSVLQIAFIDCFVWASSIENRALLTCEIQIVRLCASRLNKVYLNRCVIVCTCHFIDYLALVHSIPLAKIFLSFWPQFHGKHIYIQVNYKFKDQRSLWWQHKTRINDMQIEKKTK